MGMFMASVSFRCADREKWQKVRPAIEDMFLGLEGLVSNFDSEGPGYVILSPYGDMGMFLAELPERITKLTGDYAIMAMCVDSDFDVLELYQNGNLLEKTYIGDIFEEYDDFPEYDRPNIDLWAALLTDSDRLEELRAAMSDVDVFAEDNLRVLSELTGMPIFDDELMLEAE